MRPGATEPPHEHGSRHQSGAHDRWTGSGEDDVAAHHAGRDERRGPASTRSALERPNQRHDERRHDGDVPARDRDDVGQAGRGEGVIDLRRDRGAHPEEDAGTKRGFGLGHEVIETVQQHGSERGHGCAWTARALDDMRGASPGNAAHALARQVLPIGEAVEVLRQFDARPQYQPVPAACVDPAREPHEQPVDHADRLSVNGGGDLRQDQLQPVGARPWVIGDRPDEVVLGTVGQSGHGGLASVERFSGQILAPRSCAHAQ